MAPNPNQSYARQYKSPVFTFSNSGSIASSGFKLFDFNRDNTNCEAYNRPTDPFNNLVITNSSSSCDLLVFLNQNQANGGVIIKANSEKAFDQSSIGGIQSVLIQNLSSTGTINANEIRVITWKDKANSATIVSSLHRFLLNSNPASWQTAFNASDLLNRSGFI